MFCDADTQRFVVECFVLIVFAMNVLQVVSNNFEMSVLYVFVCLHASMWCNACNLFLMYMRAFTRSQDLSRLRPIASRLRPDCVQIAFRLRPHYVLIVSDCAQFASELRPIASRLRPDSLQIVPGCIRLRPDCARLRSDCFQIASDCV